MHICFANLHKNKHNLSFLNSFHCLHIHYWYFLGHFYLLNFFYDCCVKVVWQTKISVVQYKPVCAYLHVYMTLTKLYGQFPPLVTHVTNSQQKLNYN